ncbi:MAG: hypothetical protein Ct9H300mP19_20860 [Dehalococcoidia bacterium]|nr:MAG: hypothetical protein Ct9H300mP19_20860 [Dehalococcoidia bacterium]
MLPVVMGVKHTTNQILLYTAVLSVLTILFGFVSQALGWIYTIGSASLNLTLFWYAYRLFKDPDRPTAIKLYKYSLLYLALFFLLVMIDSVLE